MTDHLSRVEVYKDRDKQWRFRAVALNNEIVAVSEAYVEQRDALAEASKLWSDVPIEICNVDSQT